MSQTIVPELLDEAGAEGTELPENEPTAARAAAAPTRFDFASEDDLDWAENQGRTRRDATGLDVAFIGIAITLTAVVLAIAIGISNRA